MESRPILLAFNRGLVSKRALARVDLKRMALSAEQQSNWLPRVLGSMSLRNGTRLIRSTFNDQQSVHVPFIFSLTDTAKVELTNLIMRVEIGGTIISRPTVATTITNGTFATDLSGWTGADEAGATSAWATGGYMNLKGNGTAHAIRYQSLSIALADRGVEHAIDVIVERGTVELSVGTTVGGTTLISSMRLRKGNHSIAFTPTTANVYLQLAANDTTDTLVYNCTMSGPGDMTIDTPWPTADLAKVRYDQSGDVIFCASGTHRPQRIERQATRSWSVVDYLVEDGPFRDINTSTIKMSVDALSGNTTLRSTRDFFTATNVGSIFRLGSAGQNVQTAIGAANLFSGYIRVTGVSSGRSFLITLSGTWVGKVTLQRSVSEPGDWTDVKSWTANTSESYDDTLSNQTIYYRLGVKTGDYTSGSVTVAMSYAAGTIKGIGRITGYTDAKTVSVEVLKDFGSTSQTADWWEGMWSDRRGWPSSVILHDGRLWWAGKDKITGSVSDAFDSFDDTVEGDSGPILRSIGSGPVDSINWMLSLTSLIVGGQGKERVAKASSLDEPLTPTAFSLKPSSTLGSASLAAVQLDTSGIFVHRNGRRVYEIALDGSTYTYQSNDLTAIVPELGDAGFTKIAIQRVPDTRIHCIRPDGKVAILVFDRVEKVTCWILYETDGYVEDAIVLPVVGGDDQVTYTVRRTINGVTKRYQEQWAGDSETVGATVNILSDATVEYSGAAVATVTGLGALEGKTVCVWGNGKDLGTYTVTGGAISGLPETVTYAAIGLPYEAFFMSARFAEASQIALGQRQQLHAVGLILADTHARGVKIGQDFSHMDYLPSIERGAPVDPNSIWSEYSEDSIPVDGAWSNKSRLCLYAKSPRPATVLAAICSVTGSDK